MKNEHASNVLIAGRQYCFDTFGTLRQVDARPFPYGPEYCSSQRTTPKMAMVRLGFALGAFGYEWLRGGPNLEIGPGSGQFMMSFRELGLNIEGYDIVKTPFCSISHEDMCKQRWGTIFLYDVLEHLTDINEIWSLQFTKAVISVPLRPPMEMMEGWRHLKPDEHIWHFTRESFATWCKAHGARIVLMADCEDVMRSRWHSAHSNILSVAIERAVPDRQGTSWS